MGLFDFVKGIGKKNTAPAEPQTAQRWIRKFEQLL